MDYEALTPYVERYAGATIENPNVSPLRVVLTLRPGSRLAGYDPLNLDNLLARAVVDEATAGQGLPTTPQAYRLPVPLRCLWTEPETGLPLWAATPFSPLGESAPDVAYWHKRAQSGRWTGTKSGKYSISSTNGRWMERRVPLPTVVAEQWAADAVGDPGEVARLLANLAFVGKRRSCGFGEVATWRVEPLDAFLLVRDGLLTRPLPAGAAHLVAEHGRPDGEPAPVGWTPPQWKPDLFRPGWWTGTPVGVDWYDECP